MKADNNVPEYYDRFKGEQIKTGLNARHRNILFTLKRSGLKKNHSVLEIGCGIGIISGELSTYLKRGSVTGVDISPESIEFAKQKYKRQQNLNFIVSDIQHLLLNESFDFIILPDVLEHIPLSLYDEIFKKLIQVIKPEGRIFIHIPSGSYNQYIIDYEPEKLQIIDHALDANKLITPAETAGFELIVYKLVNLHVKEGDYAMMLFRVKHRLNSINRFRGTKKIMAELNSRIRYLRFRISL